MGPFVRRQSCDFGYLNETFVKAVTVKVHEFQMQHNLPICALLCQKQLDKQQLVFSQFIIASVTLFSYGSTRLIMHTTNLVLNYFYKDKPLKLNSLG